MMAEQWVPKDKDELMAAIDREWKLLMGVVDEMTPEQLVELDEGGWAPKDNLAHLSEWMNVLMGYHMDRQPAHEVIRLTPDITKEWDFEKMNQVLFERHRLQSTEDILIELQRTYEKLINKLNNTSWEDLMKPRRDDDPEKRPVLLWVLGDTTEHFQEHRETIEKSLR
jgi:hypothetical protein